MSKGKPVVQFSGNARDPYPHVQYCVVHNITLEQKATLSRFKSGTILNGYPVSHKEEPLFHPRPFSQRKLWLETVQQEPSARPARRVHVSSLPPVVRRKKDLEAKVREIKQRLGLDYV